MFGLRRQFKSFVYENRSKVLDAMAWIVIINSILTIGFMVYYHGFNHEADLSQTLLAINRALFGVFFLNYFVRLVFSEKPSNHLKNNWLESILLAIVMLNFISFKVFNFPILALFFDWFGFKGFETLYVFFIQLYLLLLVALELIKSLQTLENLKVRPTTLLLYSFLLLVIGGGFLLSLPGLNNTGEWLNFTDAVFTSASAACVTGLITVDTASFFNIKGQLVIMILFQIGGLGIISFATFFATFLKSGVGLKQQSMLKELFDSESLHGSVSLLRKIVFYTLSIELVSILCLYAFWGDYPFKHDGQRWYYSIFHGISAFCNAGFSLFSDGLNDALIKEKYTLHLALATTIFFGGLGFPAIRDIFELRNVRERLDKPWKKWKLSTQIAFYGSLVLIAFGAIMFFVLERKGVLANESTLSVMVKSVFQSITTRTAGFNTVDFSMLGNPILILMIFLMFVGASSGSTGGGIKTSTFVVIFAAIIAAVRGRKEAVLSRRTISQELIYKAFAVFIFSASYLFLSILFLVIAEPSFDVVALVFEATSAFATVGLSTGITPDLSGFSKYLLVISMFVGRIGVLSLAFALSTSVKTNAYRYPNSHIMIG